MRRLRVKNDLKKFVGLSFETKEWKSPTAGAMTLSITSLSITTLSIMILSITTLSITTLSTKGFFVTLNINGTQHTRN